ncbi:hypothetical protein FACS1894186_4820 [Alphaproteobacteria bacterium]|nr:hypothetical protein FACS1894186_4820 [Alphaproteobacteria bacterium]
MTDETEDTGAEVETAAAPETGSSEGSDDGFGQEGKAGAEADIEQTLDDLDDETVLKTARAMGYKDKISKVDGHIHGKLMSPREYLRSVKDSKQIIKQQYTNAAQANYEMKQRLASLEKQLAAQEARKDEAAQAAYAEQRDQLSTNLALAMTDGDRDKVLEIRSTIRNLDAQESRAAAERRAAADARRSMAAAEPEPLPVHLTRPMDIFRKDNPWFGTDKARSETMATAFEEAMRAYPSPTSSDVREGLRLAQDAVEEAHGAYKAPAAKRTGAYPLVGEGGGGTSDGGYGGLSSADRALLDSAWKEHEDEYKRDGMSKEEIAERKKSYRDNFVKSVKGDK